MNWFVAVLRKYATFTGRARRKEYWMYWLIYVLISIVLMFVDGIAGTLNADTGTGLFSSIFMLGTLLPSLAVTVRRLHDTDRNGWWILLGFIPLIGGLILLIFTVKAGDPAENRYGSSPLTGEERLAG